MAAAIFGSIGLHFHLHQTDPKVAPYALTKAQLEKIFMQFDTNGDNLLSREELQNAFTKLGAWFPGYRANRALSHADANGDGQVDLNELDDVIKYAHELGYTVK